MFWRAHRLAYRVSGGRVGLRRPRPGRWGMLRLTTVGRRSGQERSVVLAYIEDGPNLVALAMNGWADAEPAWWLNLQAQPDATVDLATGSYAVSARAAEGAERTRLWAEWQQVSQRLDEHAALRSSPTAIVVMQPR
ncbi:nitroreductase/quinone reductase family protein [Phytoactinopolyspora limicola]|uniref:nitroreductase/quinone reductase family protein n=1 Tax=Phytoactinopolyspora limicola TaxID=2715536 RepID=UPI001408A45C|nr:nitroreductase/quinone reductase family protein [Phytoactinopolyspora limicola]